MSGLEQKKKKKKKSEVGPLHRSAAFILFSPHTFHEVKYHLKRALFFSVCSQRRTTSDACVLDRSERLRESKAEGILMSSTADRST